MICIIMVALDLRNVVVLAVKHKARDEVLRTCVANLVRTIQMVAWSCQWKVCFVHGNTDQSHGQTHLQATPLNPSLRHPAKNVEWYQGPRPLRLVRVVHLLGIGGSLWPISALHHCPHWVESGRLGVAAFGRKQPVTKDSSRPEAAIH